MSPYFLLSFLIGGVYGAIFHLWRGKSPVDVIYYFVAGVIGFGIGQSVAAFLGWSFFLIGPLHIIEASLCAWASLFLARWLRL